MRGQKLIAITLMLGFLYQPAEAKITLELHHSKDEKLCDASSSELPKAVQENGGTRWCSTGTIQYEGCKWKTGSRKWDCSEVRTKATEPAAVKK